MLGLLLGILVTVAGTLALTPRMQPSANPFADFNELFSGDARQLALARGFTCGAVSFSSNPRTITDYCVMQITHSLFSQTALGLLGNAANEISFSVRENTLTLGDLAALWDKPEFWRNGESVAATWPAQRATAITPFPRVGRIGYFLPVAHISFARSGNPRWALLLTMERLPMLCSDCRGL